MRSLLLASLTLAAAGCSGGTPSQNAASNQSQAAANNSVSADAMGARIAALPEPQRLATFYRAIHDAGMDCQDVTSAAAGGTYRGMPVWNATCRGGGHWTLVIGSGGMVQVLNANEARLLTDQSPQANRSGGR